LPTDKDVRGSIEALADKLGKAGVNVTRQSPLLPDFAISSRIYLRLLMALIGASYPPDIQASARAAAAELKPDDMSLRAARLHGINLSYRDWLVADGGRTRIRAQWRELFKSFDAVICPIMPTPAYVQDQSPEQELRRISIDGQDFSYPDQLAWPGIATMPGLPATAIPLGLNAQGLPLGVQIVGPFLEDRTPLKLAELIEQQFGGFVPPKMFDD
jgi:amidase